ADVSQEFLRNYLELLDFSHLFFTQKDIDGLTTKYGTALGDDVLLGNLKPAYEIYDLYQKRVDERVAKVKELLKQPFDFKTAATVEVRREKASWPKDEADADRLWHDRIASELLQEKLSEHPIEPPPQLIARRYDRISRNVHEEDRDEQVKLYLDALAPDPPQRKNVELVRDEIKLKDQEARADIIIKKDENGEQVKLGWLTLPSFYADMDRHAKSTTRDVLVLLKRLKKENIGGLVI